MPQLDHSRRSIHAAGSQVFVEPSPFRRINDRFLTQEKVKILPASFSALVEPLSNTQPSHVNLKWFAVLDTGTHGNPTVGGWPTYGQEWRTRPG